MKIIQNKILQLYIFVVIVGAYVAGLFIDLTGDSALYATIARQMVESGDWFNLKINGVAYQEKPHLLFWLAGIGIKLFGNTNFAFKIFPFLFSLSGFYFTYRLGKTIYSEKVGKSAALIAATSQIYFLYFLDIHTDILLQAAVVLSLWQLAEYLKNRQPKNFILAFVGIGLAMFSKGPIGAVIPFFAVLFFLISTRDFNQLFHPKWIIGIAISFIIVSPTLIHLYQSFGDDGIKFFFITNNVGRITGEYAGSSSDPFYYLYNLLWASLPWTIIVLFALFSETKAWLNKKEDKSWGLFLLGSIWFFMFILSIAKGKAPNYFLIIFPSVSIITAKWWFKLTEQKQFKTIKVHNIFVTLFAAFTFVILFLFSSKMLPLTLLLSCGFILIAFVLYKLKANMGKIAILFTILTAVTLNLFLNINVIPEMFKYQGARQTLAIYEDKREANDTLINLHNEGNELFYYANSKVIQFPGWEIFFELFKTEGTWIYTNQTGYDGIMEWKVNLDTVYKIKNKNMNNLSIQFINPKTRDASLETNYLIKIH